MKKTVSLLLSLLLALSLLPVAALAADPGTYLVSVTQTVNGSETTGLQGVAVGTEVTASVTVTRTDVTEDTYHCRGMEIDLATNGLEYVSDSAVTFVYTVDGSDRNASVSSFTVDPLTDIGLLRFFFLFGRLSDNANKTTVPRTVTVSATYRVIDPDVAHAWTVEPIIYLGADKATDFIFANYHIGLDPNGGKLDNDPSGNYNEGETVTLPTPTRTGYRFLGWFDGESTHTGDWTVDGNKSFTARWERITNALLGVVREEDGTPLSGVIVKLVKGQEEFGTTVTDENERFSITAADDEYNLVAHDPATDRTKTELVTVKENAPEMRLTMPSGDKNSILDNTNAGDFAATVGGLDELAEEEEPQSGETIVITLTVTADSSKETLPDRESYETGKTAIGTLQQTKGQTLEFFNLSLVRAVVGGTNPGVTDISDSNEKLLRVIIPFSSNGKINISVYRAYASSGGAAQLTTLPNGDGEYIVVNGDQIEIYAKHFDAYAIGYNVPAAPSDDDDGGSSGSSGTTEKPKPTLTETTGVADWLITDDHILYIRGYDDGTISPNNNITRAEVATIVNHMLGRAADEAYVKANAAALKQFSDLQDSSKWYYLDMVEASNEHHFTRDADGTEKWTK